jgi:hypothetical protein
MRSAVVSAALTIGFEFGNSLVTKCLGFFQVGADLCRPFVKHAAKRGASFAPHKRNEYNKSNGNPDRLKNDSMFH